MQRFHFERTTKLSLILDSESWKQTEVPVEFQQLLDQISETGQNISFLLNKAVGYSKTNFSKKPRHVNGHNSYLIAKWMKE